MTDLSEIVEAVRRYIASKETDGGRYDSEWLDLVDDTLADIRAELASTAPAATGNKEPKQ
jgi:hypothetical protein